ncbi:MAG: DNA-3-methyladenine glycosylase 2 family protein, partial [Oscillospiraceae bacterium]|nr:DNA-3-methyladenine glycosylase 2 family protein [Oscillospiraceae bacterium]
MDYEVKGCDVILHQTELDLEHTLDCGQAFRWTKTGNAYSGYFKKLPLTVSQKGDVFTFHNVTEDEFLGVWADYFDLQTDYGEIIRRLSEDEHLAKACAYAPGIRLLRQDAEECLISFIISQNNNIPRIKGIISRLAGIYGGFPTAEELYDADEEKLSPLRAGFRTKYLLDCIEKLRSGETDIEKIRTLPLDAAAKELMKIKGVGIKVAMCTLLFGFHRTESYPVDVWIKRVNERFYPNGLPACTKGIEGIAQQYLFHAVRNG